MNANTLYAKLSAPFEDAEIEWRLQWSDETRGIAVPYVTNRAIQNRLDATVGIDGWKNEYIPWHSDEKKSSQLCGLSIRIPERGEWLTKYDGAEDSDIEPIKGGLSDSMKRAAVQWGIGRYLYSMDTVFVEVEKRGRSTVIKKSEQQKLDAAHRAHVGRMRNTAPEKTPPPQNTTPNKPASPPPAKFPDMLKVFSASAVNKAGGGTDTNLLLYDVDGNKYQMYMRGSNPGIRKGVILINIKVTEREKGGVIYYVLEEYEIDAKEAA